MLAGVCVDVDGIVQEAEGFCNVLAVWRGGDNVAVGVDRAQDALSCGGER